MGKKNPTIGRKWTAPFLVRVFINLGPHRQFGKRFRPQESKSELQVYLWMDATLRELTDLIKKDVPNGRRTQYISFRSVSMSNAWPIVKHLGTLRYNTFGQDDSVTMRNLKFE